jgi:hypothetical protein
VYSWHERLAGRAEARPACSRLLIARDDVVLAHDAPVADLEDRVRDGVDRETGMGEQMRTLSSQKLGEVEALLERTKAMKGWLEVAKECGCATPAECALFPALGEHPVDPALPLR